jgi:CDP-glucose 4,6-dehydratase
MGKLEDYHAVERAVNEHEVDVVFNLGEQTIVGTAIRNPLPTFDANIRGTYNVLEVCRTHGGLVKSVVVASSDKAYGSVDKLPYTEDMPPQGNHPYDVSKSCADLLAMTYANAYDVPVTVARCGNIYGGGDLNWSRIVPGTIRSAYLEQRPIIRSDGTFTRDYIYVQDVVEAYLLLAENTLRNEMKGEAFNFSVEQPLSVLEITGEVLKLMNRTHLEPQILNQAHGEIRDQYLDCTKAKTVLRWRPKYTLEMGLRETIQWYEDYFGRDVHQNVQEGLR